MILALGGSYQVSEFRYLPFSWTKCTQYEVYVSATNGLWGSAVAAGTWANDSTEKTASFPPTPGAFLRIRYLDNYCYVAEHNVSGVATANQPPVAVADSATTNEGVAVVVSVLANDTDANGDGLSLSSVTQGSQGTVTHDGLVATYTPGAGYTGGDSFTYVVSDGQGGTDTGTVTMTVVVPDGVRFGSCSWTTAGP